MRFGGSPLWKKGGQRRALSFVLYPRSTRKYLHYPRVNRSPGGIARSNRTGIWWLFSWFFR